MRSLVRLQVDPGSSSFWPRVRVDDDGSIDVFDASSPFAARMLRWQRISADLVDRVTTRLAGSYDPLDSTDGVDVDGLVVTGLSDSVQGQGFPFRSRFFGLR
jgi:hypothetical protein